MCIQKIVVELTGIHNNNDFWTCARAAVEQVQDITQLTIESSAPAVLLKLLVRKECTPYFLIRCQSNHHFLSTKWTNKLFSLQYDDQLFPVIKINPE